MASLRKDEGVEQLGLGLIGTGRIAHSHLRALADYLPARVNSVFDVLPDRAEAFAQQFSIPSVSPSLEDLLARTDIDAVIVATPPFAHAQPTIAALEAGKHVLCEKPFSLSVPEAEQMVATAERTGRFLAVCSARYRHADGARRAHELVAAGELGTIYHARSSAFRLRGRPGIDMFTDATWFIDKTRAGGGALIDIGVYQIDLLLWMLGNPHVTSVLATGFQGIGDPPPAGVVQTVEDHAVVMIRCDNGASAVLEIAWSSNITDNNAFLVFGTEAGLRLNPLRKVTVSPDRKPVEERLLPEEGPESRGFGRVTTGFVDDILAGRQPWTSGRDALEVTRVIDAAYRSIATGRAVEIASIPRLAESLER
ncbi:MAG: Gfo/Idh/MocA family oxidoreductase [Chloroflexi bacterium]|nr:Gfo/Idh/MocA family oxidoreductase [Chloroflexota bacterium]